MQGVILVPSLRQPLRTICGRARSNLISEFMVIHALHLRSFKTLILICTKFLDFQLISGSTCTRWQISVESLNTRVKLARKNAEMSEPAALEGRHP